MKKVFNDLEMFKHDVNRAAWHAGITLYVKNDRKKIWAIDTSHSQPHFVALLELKEPVEKDILVKLYKESVHSERSTLDEDNLGSR